MYISDFTEHTNRMADAIDSDFNMVMVPVLPPKGAKPSFCYQNVQHKVLSAGGALQYGWTVIQTPWTVDAVHHAVWESPTGELIDVTPGIPKFDKTLFIPDDRITFSGGIIANITINITDNKVVDDLISIADFMNVIIAQSNKVAEGRREVSHPLWPKYKFFNKSVIDFLQKGFTHNSLCYCGSNKIYNLCHGKLLQEALLIDSSAVPDYVVRLPLGNSPK